ncbi:hypothetical protein [Actinoplanes teichomyceticus]|uniref:DUF2637 domain-containing protein n=1 Tax=Actinoplanes teichomyceticus TaxID=1867 RepID=A0A561VSB9_ACTTI|nr:hypothetical protein [Actinoplanes teichomyceticus]TWG14515.1 hypothetical protein FHX34_104815 [Actinoplanes teichomyceticus]GIF16860.1 hypothetical protein Ate01nite_68920 [Actinoplanes teichomyceticus]
MTENVRKDGHAISTPATVSNGNPQPSTGHRGWSPARWAYSFYAVAATGAVIGQTWVALDHLPWPPAVPLVLRVLAVLPFALCLELLAMALAAMADERMRLGERAYGLRAFSAVVAVVAVGIQVAGHWPDYYWSSVFGVLSGSAYALWMLHAAARRRDALRAAGKLADTAPDYGLWRRVRHPIWTARAAELAREGRRDPGTGAWRPLGLYESLRAAELAIGDEKRRPAVARAVEHVVRADQRDPRMAEIAVRTLDLDRLAAELAARVDYHAWADRVAPAITAPAPLRADSDANSHAELPRADDEAVPEQPQQPPATPDTDASTAEEVPSPGPLDRDDSEEAYSDQDDREGDEDGDEFDGDDDVDLASDLVPLLPAARTARDELLREGRTVSRDALAHRLRRNGTAIRNNRVSELLGALRREQKALDGARPKVPA